MADICVSNRLEIRPKVQSNMQTYISVVEEIITEDQELIIALPIYRGRPVKLLEGDIYSLLIFSDATMLSCDIKIIRMFNEDNLYHSEVKIITALTKMQRRDFFRQDCILPLKFAPLDKGQLLEEKEKKVMINGLAKNIGGGGIRFVSNYELNDDNSEIRLIVAVDNSFVFCIGKLVGKQFFANSNFKFQYRASFLSISPEDREKIIQYIFNEQRKLIHVLGKE
jgi:c-di-GMP-binding flagellar brake protein YcgR